MSQNIFPSSTKKKKKKKYCDLDFPGRFGKIHFAVGCDVTPAFKRSVLSDKNLLWHPIYKQANGKKEESGQEWSEVCFVPNELAGSKKGREYRYIAVREELVQKVFPGMEDNLELPFPTIVKISNGHPSLDLLDSARERIQQLSCLPSG